MLGCPCGGWRPSNQAFGGVVLHLEMHSRRDRDEFGKSGSPKDALVKRREIYHQELGLDGSGRYPSLECDDRLDISLGFCVGSIEALEIRSHVRGQMALIQL